MKKQDFITSCVTLFCYGLVFAFLAFTINDLILFFVIFFPFVVSFVTLDYSDNAPDWAKMTFWWPFYL